MANCLFLGDSITDAGHLFDPANLGEGYVSVLAEMTAADQCILCNRGHDGFTVEQVLRMLKRDGIEKHWDIISLLAGINDIPVEVYTSHHRIPDEFSQYYTELLEFLSLRTNARLILIEPFLFSIPQEYQNWQPYLQMESSIIRNLALRFDAALLPANEILNHAASIHGVRQITVDGIHLTSLGNRILAETWMELYQDLKN
ncbi:MAG: SGNH/GDSL hydrolase family protein [Oliverpabstia sp.]|nr:GDSL-type esterase/lipase family protein [Eubacterium sp.]MDY2596112.1 GDSL-type esterase/lipase family protein [Oliverpabstia sp.]